MRELGDASVPFVFDTHAIIYSDDAPALERALHGEFEGTRINAQNFRKEFFRRLNMLKLQFSGSRPMQPSSGTSRRKSIAKPSPEGTRCWPVKLEKARCFPLSFDWRSLAAAELAISYPLRAF
ncbi:GIY-YIG nuclease family protein [Sphingobium sp. 22B]|nr:GIY-YIG nuclease family protein [Sphingobium sp. 22B]